MSADLIKIAASQIGITEVPGVNHNQVILNYSKECGFDWINSDEVPWCSVFMNWTAMKAGYERSKSAAAISWKDVGEKITNPEPGDIAVFNNHVGIFLSKQGDLINILGGNQSNKVKVSTYKTRTLVCFRRLKKIK